MWVLFIVAWMASGPSYATHDFPDKQICMSMKYAMEKGFPDYHMKGVCMAKQVASR